MMMNNTYSEVYSVLEMYGNEYIEKLPNKLYFLIKDNRNLKYSPIYETKKPIFMQGISKEALAILTFMYLNYWVESELEKEAIEEYLNRDIKEEIKEEKIQIKEDNKINQNTVQDIIEDNVNLIENKENIFKRFLNKIKNIFKIR